MLHVVDVLSGRMLNLNAEFIHERASRVKQEIERLCGTRFVYQLLLTNDGVELQTDVRLSDDTVYLLDLTPKKSEKEVRMEGLEVIPASSVQGGGYAVLVERAHESYKLCEMALKMEGDGEVRYQQRGCNVVVDHLEKVVNECTNNSEELKKVLKEYMDDKRMFVQEIMPDLAEEMQMLNVMPMLVEDTTLLGWLEKEVFEGDVDGAAFQCCVCLEKVGKGSTEALCAKLKRIIGDVDGRKLKVLPIVGDEYEKAMRQMESLVVEQSEIAKYFEKEVRQLAGSYEDENVFETLDGMHYLKILSARTNHQVIVGLYAVVEITKMKVRQWLMDVLEARQSLLEANLMIVARKDMLVSVRHEIEIFRQVRNMSELYVEIVAEMVRRRRLVTEWGKNSEEETSKRAIFMERVGGHLIATLVSKFDRLGVEDLERVLKVFDGRDDEMVPMSVKKAREMVVLIRESERVIYV